MPYIEFLDVTIPREWFIYAFYFLLGVLITLFLATRSLGKLQSKLDADVNRRMNNMINKSMEFMLEIGLRTGINVKPHIELLEAMKKPA